MPFSTYLPKQMGWATLKPPGPFVAGSYAELTLTYTAGTFGIDDTGMVKISWRTTSDMSKPQFDKPRRANYTTVEASNGAKLEVWFDRLNIRPWANTLLIRVGRGYLREGDTLTVRFGDRRQGSPGFRLQTNCEANVELQTSVDAFATYEFCELPSSRPSIWCRDRPRAEGDLAVARGGRRAVPPRDRRRGHLGQPDRQTPTSVSRSRRRGRCAACRHSVDVQDRRRPARDRKPRRRGGRRHRSAAHGEGRGRRARQSAARGRGSRRCAATGATCTARAARPSAWARRKTISAMRATAAFIDIVGHQGNDFQITDAFWDELNRLYAEFDEPGRFVCLPGYEWSGNTGMGGDRNIFFRREGRPIRRSSHILVEGRHRPRRVLHGGRTVPCARRARTRSSSPMSAAATPTSNTPMTAGSSARSRCIRPGAPSNGCCTTRSSWATASASCATATTTRGAPARRDRAPRPSARSAASPATSCRELTRDALFAALRRRRHYGTTGTRMFLELRALVRPRGDGIFATIRKLGPAHGICACSEAVMGDIVRPGGVPMRVAAEVIGTAPIERVDVLHGTQVVAERSGRSPPPISAAACACSGRAPNIAAAAARRSGRASSTVAATASRDLRR